MRRSHFVIAAIALFALVLGVHAADTAKTPTTKPSSTRLFAPYSKMSTLTDDQKSKIHEIHQKVLAEIKEIEKKQADDILAVLDDQQKKELKELEEKDSAGKKMSQAEKDKMKDEAKN